MIFEVRSGNMKQSMEQLNAENRGANHSLIGNQITELWREHPIATMTNAIGVITALIVIQNQRQC